MQRKVMNFEYCGYKQSNIAWTFLSEAVYMTSNLLTAVLCAGTSIQTMRSKFPEGQASKVWHKRHPSSPQEQLNKHARHLSPLLCLPLQLWSLSISLSVPRKSTGLPIAGLECTKYHYLYFSPAGLYNPLFCRIHSAAFSVCVKVPLAMRKYWFAVCCFFFGLVWKISSSC